jgi:hypothetical protein
MNDFTKEELEKILNCVAFTCWEHPMEDEKLTSVRIKIESMIGSYCEHESPSDLAYLKERGFIK